MSKYTTYLIESITAQVQSAGWLEAYAIDVIDDRPNHIRVEVKFGVLAKYGAPKFRPIDNSAPFVIVDQTMINDEITAYQYDFIDDGYDFRLAYHLHGETDGIIAPHRHLEPGDKRSSYEKIELDQALTNFFAAFLENRWGRIYSSS